MPQGPLQEILLRLLKNERYFHLFLQVLGMLGHPSHFVKLPSGKSRGISGRLKYTSLHIYCRYSFLSFLTLLCYAFSYVLQEDEGRSVLFSAFGQLDYKPLHPIPINLPPYHLMTTKKKSLNVKLGITTTQASMGLAYAADASIGLG